MPPSYDSNVDDVFAWLTRCVDGFSLAESGRGNSIAETIAQGIEERSDQRQQGADEPWPENSDNPPGKGYRSRKRRKYKTDKTNYRTKQMLSRESLLGEVVVNKDSVTINYGTGKPPTAGAEGYIENSDKQITDIEKAFYAHQLDRPFFELDEQLIDKVFDDFCDELEEHLQSC